MTAEQLSLAVSLSAFILAIASAVLAITSAVWQWAIHRDTQAAQRDTNALLAKVSEKVDLVARHTSRQVDRAFDVISQQVAQAKSVAADYERAPAPKAASATSSDDNRLGLVIFEGVCWELASLAQDYVEGSRGREKPDMGDAISALADMYAESVPDGGLVRDLRLIQARWTAALSGTLSKDDLAAILPRALQVVAFLRPRLLVPEKAVEPASE